jgi:hypothetical protein
MSIEYDHELIDADDNDDFDEPDAEEFADPSCIACGGQGGWCGSFTRDGQCVWVECDCVN